ncbi:MAG: HD domain-containing protein [Gemmatimonadota bacterium]
MVGGFGYGMRVRSGLHPIVATAGREGRLPIWASVTGKRRIHVESVASLMSAWAEALDLGEEDRVRWRAAGFLHDALKGGEIDELRIWGGRDWPDPLVHGPACAGRLRQSGVKDEELLLAIEYHSVGHPSFEALGECLYLADFLEPHRNFRKARRESFRARLPGERHDVLIEVLALRLTRLLDKRFSIMQASIDFWNRLLSSGETPDELA